MCSSDLSPALSKAGRVSPNLYADDAWVNVMRLRNRQRGRHTRETKETEGERKREGEKMGGEYCFFHLQYCVTFHRI